MADQNQDLPLVVAEILIEIHELGERLTGVEKAVNGLGERLTGVEKAVNRMAELMLLQQQETNRKLE